MGALSDAFGDVDPGKAIAGLLTGNLHFAIADSDAKKKAKSNNWSNARGGRAASLPQYAVRMVSDYGDTYYTTSSDKGVADKSWADVTHGGNSTNTADGTSFLDPEFQGNAEGDQFDEGMATMGMGGSLFGAAQVVSAKNTWQRGVGMSQLQSAEQNKALQRLQMQEANVWNIYGEAKSMLTPLLASYADYERQIGLINKSLEEGIISEEEFQRQTQEIKDQFAPVLRTQGDLEGDLSKIKANYDPLLSDTMGADPGYNFQLSQMETGLNSQLSKAGVRRGGAALEAFRRGYQEVSANEAQRWFTNQLQTRSALEQATTKYRSDFNAQQGTLRSALADRIATMRGEMESRNLSARAGIASNKLAYRTGFEETQRNVRTSLAGLATHQQEQVNALGNMREVTVGGYSDRINQALIAANALRASGEITGTGAASNTIGTILGAVMGAKGGGAK